ncbi:MAG: DUF4159 domain-containing protein [Planctomycetota bacterium]|jgi:hypothetical protein
MSSRPDADSVHRSPFTVHRTGTRHPTPGTRPRRAGPILLLTLILFFAGVPAGRAPATCRCGSGSLEVVLVLDTTSSMHVMIGTVKEQLYRLIAALEGGAERLRVGAVIYRSPEAPEYVTRIHGLSEDRAALAEWIKKAKVRGGGYEAVEKGLERAVTEMAWTKGARKVIILVGDEGPSPENRERCLRLARLAKSRGIAVNTVTCSMTAWSYWQLTNTEEWKRRYARLGDKAKREFELPLFQRIAREGGGVSVPSWRTRDLLRWLLTIASGREKVEEAEVDRFMAWDPAKGAAQAGRNPMLAQLRYRGSWNTPRNFEALREALGRKVRLDFDSSREVVAAREAELRGRPLLYVTGHGEIGLSAEEKTALRNHLRDGGLLWADCCCARKEFDAAIRKLAAELFPGKKLAPLPADHAVYRSGYVVTDLRWAESPRAEGTALVEKPPALEGLTVGGRLAVVYSPNSLGCGWASYPMGRVCAVKDADALKLSINVLLYALTAGRPGEPGPAPAR